MNHQTTDSGANVPEMSAFALIRRAVRDRTAWNGADERPEAPGVYVERARTSHGRPILKGRPPPITAWFICDSRLSQSGVGYRGFAEQRRVHPPQLSQRQHGLFDCRATDFVADGRWAGARARLINNGLTSP
jgi:hypothetical protein